VKGNAHCPPLMQPHDGLEALAGLGLVAGRDQGLHLRGQDRVLASLGRRRRTLGLSGHTSTGLGGSARDAAGATT
jgi:hypothetical protein